MLRQKLNTQPVKGFRDFTPEDWTIQQYIFDTWKRVCELYAYKEYNGPVLEYSQIYNKSGDDVGTSGKELYKFTDKGDRELALRPEMTPTVGRMIAEYANSYSKPIRWFSIAQFFRAEKPQRGRGREFFQLNADIFGDDSINSDFEILNLAIDIMKAFKANEEMFEVRINNRKFTDFYFENILGIKDPKIKSTLIKLIDASSKKPEGWLESEVEEVGELYKNFSKPDLSDSLYSGIRKYLSLSIDDLSQYSDSKGAGEIITLFKLLKKLDLEKYCIFDTSMSRGFDYYTGMVFEVFDRDVSNNRSMFGGGRYDDLLDIFGKPKIPAVGFAPGDITTGLFLKSWGLLKNVDMNLSADYYIPLMFAGAFDIVSKVAKKLRDEGKKVQIGLDIETISKALSFASKNLIKNVVILGETELKDKKYKIKDMSTGKEEEKSLFT